MKDFKRLNVIFFRVSLLLIVVFISSCTFNSNQNLDTETINYIYPVFETEKITAVTVKPIEDKTDLVYLLYESSPTNISIRSKKNPLFMEGLYFLNTQTGSTEKATDTLSTALIGTKHLLALDDMFVYIKANKLGSLSETAQLNWENDYSDSDLLCINTINDKTHGLLLSLFMKNAQDEFSCVLLDPVNGQEISQNPFNNFITGEIYYGPFQGFESPFVLSKAENYHISNSEGLFLTPSFEETETIISIAVQKNTQHENILCILSVYDSKVFKTIYDTNGSFLSRKELSENNDVSLRNTRKSNREWVFDSSLSPVPITGTGNSTYFVSQTGIPQVSNSNNIPEYIPDIKFAATNPITINECEQGRCFVTLRVQTGKYNSFYTYLDGNLLDVFDVAVIPQDNGIYDISFHIPQGTHKIKIFGEYNYCYSNEITTTLDCQCPGLTPTIKWNPQNSPVETTHEATAGLSIWSNQELNSISLTNNGIPQEISTPLSLESTDDENFPFGYGLTVDTLNEGENSIEVIGINENGNSNTLQHTMNRTPPSSVPVIGWALDEEPPQTTTDPTLTLNMVSDQQLDSLTITHNGVENVLNNPDHQIIGEEFQYTERIDLTEGPNTFSILGENENGSSDPLNFNIQWTPQAPPPVLTFPDDNQPPQTTTEEVLVFSIHSDQDIDTLTITVNDEPPTVIDDPVSVPAGPGDDGIILNTQVTLTGENNLVSIVGENENGSSDPLNFDIQWTAQAEPPILTFPEGNQPPQTTSEEFVEFSVHSDQDIDTLTITVNDEPPTVIDDPVSVPAGPGDDGIILNTQVTLTGENNLVSVVGENENGSSDPLNFDIQWTAQAEPPILTFPEGNQPPQTTSEEFVEFSVQSDQDIDTLTITVNDEPPTVINDPDFVPGGPGDDTFTLNTQVDVPVGNNTISVVGENENGLSDPLNFNVERTTPSTSPVLEFFEQPPAQTNDGSVEVVFLSPDPIFAFEITHGNADPETVTAPNKEQREGVDVVPLPLDLIVGENNFSIRGMFDQGWSNSVDFTIVRNP